MLPSKNRLRKKSDINNVFRQGAHIAGNFVFLRFAKNNLNANRFAFVVSSKISKKAVLRNKIKRQLREIFKKIAFKQQPGLDFLVIAKPGIVGKKFKDIEKEINEAFDSKNNKIISKKLF
jgi:ribonuclease P protein component